MKIISLLALLCVSSTVSAQTRFQPQLEAESLSLRDATEKGVAIGVLPAQLRLAYDSKYGFDVDQLKIALGHAIWNSGRASGFSLQTIATAAGVEKRRLYLDADTLSSFSFRILRVETGPTYRSKDGTFTVNARVYFGFGPTWRSRDGNDFEVAREEGVSFIECADCPKADTNARMSEDYGIRTEVKLGGATLAFFSDRYFHRVSGFQKNNPQAWPTNPSIEGHAEVSIRPTLQSRRTGVEAVYQIPTRKKEARVGYSAFARIENIRTEASGDATFTTLFRDVSRNEEISRTGGSIQWAADPLRLKLISVGVRVRLGQP